jgi:hypothetical protein
MTRRTRRASGAAAEPTGAPEAAPAAVTDQIGGVELLEDRTLHIAGGPTGRRFGMSVSGAVAGVFLIVALAFGAGLQPTLDPSDAGHGGGDATGDLVADKGDSYDGGGAFGHDGEGDFTAPDGDKPGDETPGEDTAPDGDKPVEVTGDEPKPDEPPADPKPDEPSHDPTTMELGLALDGFAVVVEWSVCDFDGFRYYKVVRSTDESVTWPLGEGDVLVGAFDGITETRMVDSTAAHGKTYFYRVFAVRSVDGGGDYVVACKSDVKSITTTSDPAPEPKPDPKPDPKPTPDGLWLEVWIAEGHPVIKWGSCGDVAFDKIKVVRSLDGTVTWPLGENDALIAVTGPDGHKAWDKDAPGGMTLFYRVFCVRSTEGGYAVANASVVGSVVTPVVEPPPDPITLGFEAALTGDGVVLHWEDCTSETFSFYKVVRSMNPNPSYLPYTDGTQVIGVIDNHSVTGLTDSDVASGQTWYYRVQSIGHWNGQKIVLGQTAVIAVTIP